MQTSRRSATRFPFNRFLPLLLVSLSFSFFPCPVSSAILGMTRRESESQRYVHIFNDGGRRVDVLWINRFVKPTEYVSQTEKQEGIPYGGETSIKTYVGHSFQIREMPGKKSGKCVKEYCRTLEFTVMDSEGQEVFIDKDFELIFTDAKDRAKQKADKAVEECRASILNNGNDDDDPLISKIDALADCMERQIDERLTWEEDERNFQSKLRRQMAAELPGYACGDVSYETTEEIWNSTWSYGRPRGQKQKYFLKTYHQRPQSSAIVSVANFVTVKECVALNRLRTKQQQGGSGSDGDAGNNGTPLMIPFDAVNGNTQESWTTHTLAARMYKFVEDQMKWESLEFQDQYNLGQELFELHHDTKGVDVPVVPICGAAEKEAASASIGSDGQVVAEESTSASSSLSEGEQSCRLPGASPEAVPTRKFDASDRQAVASVFLFCDKTTSLGGIHFPYAGVHVNPEKGTAVLAVHRYPNKPDDSEYDGYAQEFHLCPNHNVYVHTLLETAEK
mmetsp:Transcript_14441/g.22703  ORF Transcript_14441/g.22703 Transcript_14441/m.22703 type:complete len:506 (-) Transcript_14441:64-1581(-)